MSKKLETASVLAFERKLDPSDALFFYGRWENRERNDGWEPVKIREKSVRGTISNRLSGAKYQDPLKIDAAIENPNLQTIDVATIPEGSDTLRVRFYLRVLPGLGVPSACNNLGYKQRIAQVIKDYSQKNGLAELSHRYASNIANGRFLWRNRLGAERSEVRIRDIADGVVRNTWTFDAFALSLREFCPVKEASNSLKEVASLIEKGLLGSQHVLFEIESFVRMGVGEVYPSQELILDKGQGRKSKTLYQVDGIAGIHSQKIGNAIRTIDTWYPDASFPIAVEPYGSVTSEGKAYRHLQNKTDFYSLLDSWLIKDNAPSQENQHFVVAILIRGGVFGEKEEKKKEKTSNEE
jgi:CRISPR-associated protein Csy3